MSPFPPDEQHPGPAAATADSANSDAPGRWRPLTSVEGLPLIGVGRVRTRLQTPRGVLLEIIYPAGVCSPEHRHAHDSFIHLLEGFVRGTVDGRAAELRAGEVLLHPAGVLHSVEAVTLSRWLEFKAPPGAWS